MSESQAVSGKTGPMARRDRIAGGVLVLVGAYVLTESLNYNIGTLSRMGPGILPAALGVLLAVLGIAIALVAPDARQKNVPPVALRPAVTVLAALLAFALIVEPAGLVPATAALVAVSGLADPEHTIRSLLYLFLCLSALVWIVFVQALGIPFQLVTGVL